MGSSHMNAAALTNRSARRNDAPDVQGELLEFSRTVSAWQTPSEVLDALHHVARGISPHVSVLLAVRFPLKANDWDAIRLGKSIFLHKDVPNGWWDEHVTLAPTRFTPKLFLARSSLASFTWTETKRMLEPIGIDRWADELALKLRHARQLQLSRRRAMVDCVLVEKMFHLPPPPPFSHFPPQHSVLKTPAPFPAPPPPSTTPQKEKTQNRRCGGDARPQQKDTTLGARTRAPPPRAYPNYLLRPSPTHPCSLKSG